MTAVPPAPTLAPIVVTDSRAATGVTGRVAGLLVLPLLGASPAALADEALTYDPNGNIQTRTLPGGATTYGYDALDRLTSETGPAKTQILTYDPNANRLSDSTGSKTYTTNTNRLLTENGQSITLDATGNITQARGLTFVWNQRAGQLKTVSQGSTLLATYFYDYHGRRSRKITTASAPQGAGTVIYTYDLYDRLKGELDGAGNPQRTYVWRDEVPVSIIVHRTPEAAWYLEVEHLNTPLAARDPAGTVVWMLSALFMECRIVVWPRFCFCLDWSVTMPTRLKAIVETNQAPAQALLCGKYRGHLHN